ncbi:MAG: L-serine ammonia-lyase, iron-sulfur-dependent, subunit alpha, partial [Planctomycetota bacterium]|nr:L-serine ammonia-lyase, iron-sulfur-dependent, subunit alpha [Planctomycetota bacterium]
MGASPDHSSSDPSALPPSIFNDVLGPVMRGPSSSHSAASVRIGRLARQLLGGALEEVLVEFDTGGSLATTYESQGSALGMHAGLLGWEADDPRIPEGAQHLAAAGIRIEVRARELGDPHPNTYRLTLTGPKGSARLVALSTGGGMIEVVEVDGFPVSLRGDTHVALVRQAARAPEGVAGLLRATVTEAAGASLLVVESEEPLDPEVLGVESDRICRLEPVLPVPSRASLSVPFLHAGELAAQADLTAAPLSTFALQYECARSGFSEAQVFATMDGLRRIMRAGIDGGLAGTHAEDRLLPRQSNGFEAALKEGRLHDAGLLNRTILYVTALMETKSSMGTIVAAPTAGSCATFPATCLAAAEAMGADEERTLRAMLAAGLIGVFVTTRSSFAAEVGGCQAETGAGAAMAAAALVELSGGSAERALSAA